jgi:AmmeMemoRadiSam system protein B
VFILGPSHQIPFRGIAVYDEGAWNTPLGAIEVDQDAATQFMELSGQPGAKELHRVEHSLEVQIPFLQTVLHGVKIVPLMLGPFDSGMMKEAGDALGQILVERQGALAVASSDLYHGNSFEECKATDERTISLILSMDETRLMDALMRGEAQACGGGAIALLMRACRAASAGKAELLEYTNSAEVMGDTHGYTVGYASIAFTSDKS